MKFLNDGGCSFTTTPGREEVPDVQEKLSRVAPGFSAELMEIVEDPTRRRLASSQMAAPSPLVLGVSNAQMCSSNRDLVSSEVSGNRDATSQPTVKCDDGIREGHHCNAVLPGSTSKFATAGERSATELIVTR